MHKTIAAACIAALPLSLAAQSVVSPTGLASTDGNSGNTFPWNNTFHYQQVHGDIRGKALMIKGQAHRRDAAGATNTTAVARMLDVEIWQGEGTFGPATTTTFANNYTTKPTLVFTRKVVNAPDWTQKPATSPAAFDLVFPYDTPANYSGKQDLVWEMVVHVNSATTSYSSDANSVSAPSTAGSILGTGCTATGRTAAMSHTVSYVSNQFLNRLQATLSVSNGPASAAGVILLGATNPALPLPGFCGTTPTLFTDGQVQISGTTSSAGALSSGALSVPWNNSFQGITLYSQAAAVDAPLPAGLALSNGRSATIVALGAAAPYARIYASGNPTATTGTVGLGYAIVTEFQL